MIPSLAAAQLRRALIEYLTTTFAIGDEATRRALETFLQQSPSGIFRGPYLRVRPPFRRVAPEWRSPLDVLPDGWTPFVHQAKAYERLSTRDRDPQPTIVTTGTGSGKTEAFLHPILDHCARAAEAGTPGIKAIVLYPMNALATDQAGRIAEAVAADPRLADVSAGLYIGGEGGNQAIMTRERVIDHKDVLRDEPPDILLTNYKMLDFLLLRDADRPLWRNTGPDTLRYLVLDELHTYDGAQGTDVAMLLRRLGATLRVTEPGRPLGRVAPVATSATLGETTDAAALREFAERVFGVQFEAEAVIGEDRLTVREACRAIDFRLPVPELDDLPLGGDEPDSEFDANAIAGLFVGYEPEDVFALGEALLAHRLTRAVLEATHLRATAVDEALEEIVQRAPEWGADLGPRRADVERAVGLFLALLSIARRPHPGGDPGGLPLFSMEVQLWVREVSRVLRDVAHEPSFAWLDGAAPDLDELPEAPPALAAPAIYCRQCGRTGWMGRAAELDGALTFGAATVYEESVQRSPRLRAFVRASEEEDGVLSLDPRDLALAPVPATGTIPVLVTPDDEHARRSECPSCRTPEGIRFIGSRVASLASVSISQLFGSKLVADDERKLLAFTDAVQDASHRAAFFNGRTHRFNLRIAMATAVRDAGDTMALADIGERLLAAADADRDPPAALYALIPPDLLRHEGLRTLWQAPRPVRGARELLRRRLDFEAHLELGSRARLGRTLELSRTLAAEVVLDDAPQVVELIDAIRAEHAEPVLLDPAVAPDPETYVRGLLERLRLQGAILHPWLSAYVKDDGRRWRIWGGRPEGMPAFARGQTVPTLLTTGRDGPFDAIAGAGTAPTWLSDWAARTLGVEARSAAPVNWEVLRALAHAEVVLERRTASGNTVYGLDPARIAVNVLPAGKDASGMLRCTVCTQRHVVAAERHSRWEGAACLRYRCPGRYEPVGTEPGYYRSLYLSGQQRRAVAAEHTGGLDRKPREELERAFKSGGAPDAPNVLSCTPTLEMGVDIGDLSAVLLTSVPRSAASYMQRVGRAGRRSGNALVTTFVRTEPRGLYYLSDPRHLIAGAVRPPSCWLDAIEILRRQYTAFVLDRAADETLPAPAMPHQMGQAAKSMLADSGFLRAVVDGHDARAEELVTAFLAQFGAHVSPATAERLREFARDGLGPRIEEAIGEWQERYDELLRRRSRLTERIAELENLAERSEEQEAAVKSLGGERQAIVARFRRMREEYVPSGLERLGLLPNYTLLDDGVRFEASLWSRTGAGDYGVERVEYVRPARLAIHELAPGARFYGAGHRHTVDALELGPSGDPGYEEWRFCPACGYGEIDAGPKACPRCSAQDFADAQSRHTLLRLRAVSALESEEQARVSDEQDERERTPFTVVTAVDVDPEDVQPGMAWRLEDELRPFGAEYAQATLRWLNLGRADRPGEPVSVAGRSDLRAARFVTCRYCGVVQGARDDASRGAGQDAHRGFCPVRSRSRAPQFDRHLLMHELRTDVVRIMLPLADFEVRERLASFRAALLFGLQLHFGGDPDHLRVVAADAPGGEDGTARRRFLVVHDIVPGGTGYLERLARPGDLEMILRGARAEIVRCPCKDEGRAACHRCLLGHADHGDEGLVSRRLAVELLDDVLGRWHAHAVSTIGTLPIGAVEESELERRLRHSLIRWAETTDGASVEKVAGAPGKQPDLELRVPAVGDAGRTLRYRISEQVDLETDPPTRPDFVIERLDAAGPEIAIYSDGFAYHAHPARQATLRGDARKRHGVRASGRWVWSMDYADVVAFQSALEVRVHKHPPDRPLLAGKHLAVAQHVQHARGGTLPVERSGHNPLRQLLEYLADPDSAAWRRLARSAIAGAVAGTEGPPSFSAATRQGVRLDAALNMADPNAERWTVRLVLDDSEGAMNEAEHRDRWRDWLHWGNLLQFLNGDSCQSLITVTSEEAGMADDLHPVGAGAPPTVTGDGLSAETEAELQLVDDMVRDLVRAALLAGAPPFTAGYELDDGTLLEAAWPETQVAVLLEGDEPPTGWAARAADDWAADELAAAAKGGG